MLNSRIDLAIEKHNLKYNCAQSIACTYCDLLGVDEEVAFKSVEALGFGMGCNLTCGVLSAIAYLVGLKLSDGNLNNPESKHDCYDLMCIIEKDFTNYCKSNSCYILKGIDRGLMLDCSWIISYGAYLVEKYLFPNTFIQNNSYLNYKNN